MEFHPREPALGEVDLERPNAARMYDYVLGGAHNFKVDRDAVAEALAGHPAGVRTIRENRAFLGRAVRWCLDQGIDQFLDLGSGVPTVGNVHEIAHASNPAARVAYVEVEPVAVAHAREITADLDTVSITHADLRDRHQVLTAPGVAGLLDFSRPIALLVVAVLHYLPDPDAPDALAGYVAALPAGSAVVFSHTSTDHDDPALAAGMAAAAEVYRRSPTPGVMRDRAQLRALLDHAHLALVEPGLVDVAGWPDQQDEPSGHYGAVARL